MLCRVQLFQRFEKFRVIVLGGDGSIGWVMSTLDKYNLHSKVRGLMCNCKMSWVGGWEGPSDCATLYSVGR